MRLLLVAVAALVVAASATAAPAGQVQRGKALYGQYCTACHGDNGQGVNPSRTIGGAAQRDQKQMRGLGPSLRGVGALAADFYLRTGYMPLHHVGLQPRRAQVLFDEAQIRALVAYVASLGKGPPIPKPQPHRGNVSEGMQLFAGNCAGCHQIQAQGGVVSGAVPPPLEEATAVQIAQAVRIGPFVMPRFTETQISNRQLDSIIRYVETTKGGQNAGGWSLGTIGPMPEGLVTWFIAAALLVLLCMIIGKRLHRG
jgi:ubiquinol-cytochrome c reductase cytochrome c subunit